MKALDVILPALATGAVAVVFKLAGIFYFGGLAGWGFSGEMLMYIALAGGVLLAYTPIRKRGLRLGYIALALVVCVSSLITFDHFREHESRIGEQNRDVLLGAIAFAMCYLSFGFLMSRLVRQFTAKSDQTGKALTAGEIGSKDRAE